MYLFDRQLRYDEVGSITYSKKLREHANEVYTNNYNVSRNYLRSNRSPTSQSSVFVPRTLSSNRIKIESWRFQIIVKISIRFKSQGMSEIASKCHLSNLHSYFHEEMKRERTLTISPRWTLLLCNTFVNSRNEYCMFKEKITIRSSLRGIQKKTKTSTIFTHLNNECVGLS